MRRRLLCGLLGARAQMRIDCAAADGVNSAAACVVGGVRKIAERAQKTVFNRARCGIYNVEYPS